MKILLLLFIVLTSAHAEEEHKFRPDYWSRGLHLAAGGGLNMAYYDSNELTHDIGYGINFKTDLGYYFTNRFAIEWSSNVKFNRVDGYQIWDTLITGGIRYRIKEYYVRAFVGKAPTVIFFDDKDPEQFRNTKASRLQFDSPVYGIAVGKMYNNRNGLIWFLEGSTTLQRLEEYEAIHMDGQVPEVVSRERDPSSSVTAYATIGVLIF